jgi:hypothetical protein
MKFFTSDFWTFDGKPRPWCDYGLDKDSTIQKYFADIVEIFDADTCGDIEVFFAFEDGTTYRLDYSYWFDWDDEDGPLLSEWEYKEIPPEDAENVMLKYRSIMGKPHDAYLNEYLV